MGVVWLGITRKMDRLIERKAALAAEKARLNLAIGHVAADGAAANEEEFKARTGASRELALKEAELTKAIEAYTYFEKAGERLATKTLFVIVFLFAVTVSGFTLWYTRVQVHLDRQVIDTAREQKAKADMAELELQQAKARK